jgi:hypothetical protein
VAQLGHTKWKGTTASAGPRDSAYRSETRETPRSFISSSLCSHIHSVNLSGEPFGALADALRGVRASGLILEMPVEPPGLEARQLMNKKRSGYAWL